MCSLGPVVVEDWPNRPMGEADQGFPSYLALCCHPPAKIDALSDLPNVQTATLGGRSQSGRSQWPDRAAERTVALIQMSLHVVQLSLDVARNLHAQLLVEFPLLLYLRCRATRGREKINESQLCTTFRNALRAFRRPTLTLLESRDQLVDNVLHCSVMAAKKDKVISLILRLCVFHLMILMGDFF